MQIKDLIPWGSRGRGLAKTGEDSPFLALQRDINRVFEDFWKRFDLTAPFGGNGQLNAFGPRADIAESDKEVEITVELPGMDENDIEVALSDDILTIKGEKKTDREEDKKGYYLSERSYGSFYRTIALPPGVDTEKADARFKKGVLTVTLPKTPEAQARVKKVEVKSGA